MFDTLLIANRGAIACRILRTLRAMQVKGVAVYSEADLSSLHIRDADEALSLGDGPAAQTYLVTEKIPPPRSRAAPKRSTPATAFCLKTRPSLRPARRRGWRLSAPLRNSCAPSA